MKLRNQGFILIVRDGEILRPEAIVKKIAPAMAVFQILWDGGKVTKAQMQEAKTELENLRDSLTYIKKAGK